MLVIIFGAKLHLVNPNPTLSVEIEHRVQRVKSRVRTRNRAMDTTHFWLPQMSFGFGMQRGVGQLSRRLDGFGTLIYAK